MLNHEAKTEKRGRPSRAERFYAERKEWTEPDIVLNPLGTLLIWNGTAWTMAPWIWEFMREVRRRFYPQADLRTMISMQGALDLLLLASGLSWHFGKPQSLWPKEPPISAILNMTQRAYPEKIYPELYIDCIPSRMIETLKERSPDIAIYWRPSSASIKGMQAFHIAWTDEESELIDYPVLFAAQPEDVISALETKKKPYADA